MNTKTIEINEKQKELIREIFFEENTWNSTTGNKTGLQKYSFPTIWIAFVTWGIVVMQAIIQLVTHFLEKWFSFSGTFSVLWNIFTESLILIALWWVVIYAFYSFSNIKWIQTFVDFEQKLKLFQKRYLHAEKIDKDTDFYSAWWKTWLIRWLTTYSRNWNVKNIDWYSIESDKIYTSHWNSNISSVVEHCFLMRSRLSNNSKYSGIKIQPNNTNDLREIYIQWTNSLIIWLIISVLAHEYIWGFREQILWLSNIITNNTWINNFLEDYGFMMFWIFLWTVIFLLWYIYNLFMRYKSWNQYQNTEIDVTIPTDMNLDFYTDIIASIKQLISNIELNSNNIYFQIRNNDIYLKLDIKHTGNYSNYLSDEALEFLSQINPNFNKRYMLQLMFHTLYFLNSHKAFENFLEQNSESLL